MCAYINFFVFITFIMVGAVIFHYCGKYKKKINQNYVQSIKLPVLERVLSVVDGNFQISNRLLGLYGENVLKIVSGVKRNEKNIKFYSGRSVKGKKDDVIFEFYTGAKEQKKREKINFDIKTDNVILKKIIGLAENLTEKIERTKYDYMLAANFKLPNVINGKMLILPKGTSVVALNKFFPDLRKVRLKEKETDKLFDVYANSREIAEITLKYSLNYALTEIKKHYITNFGIICIDGKFSVVLISPHDFCFFEVTEELDNSSRFGDIYGDVEYIFSISDIIKNNF